MSIYNKEETNNFASPVWVVLNRFSRAKWLLVEILWNNERLLLKQEKEKTKHLLTTVYWFVDVYDIFPDEYDEEKILNILQTLFKYQTIPNNYTETLADNL